MPPRVPSRSVNWCVMEMLHFETCCTLHSGTAQADTISEADMVYNHGLFLGRMTELLSAVTQVELKFSCTSKVTDTKLIKKQSITPHCSLSNISCTLSFLLSFTLTHTHTYTVYNHTTLILFHHSYFLSLLPPPFPVTICTRNCKFTARTLLPVALLQIF